jgi:hypothetical protein
MSSGQPHVSPADATALEAERVVPAVVPDLDPVLCEPPTRTGRSDVCAVHGSAGRRSVVAT